MLEELSVCPAFAHKLAPVRRAAAPAAVLCSKQQGGRTCLSRAKELKGPQAACRWAVHAASQSSRTRRPRRWSSRSSADDMAPLTPASGDNQQTTCRVKGGLEEEVLRRDVGSPASRPLRRSSRTQSRCSPQRRARADRPSAGEPQTGRATHHTRAACGAKRRRTSKTPQAHSVVAPWRPRRAARRASAATTTGRVTTRR